MSVWHYTYNALQVYDKLPVSAISQCNPYASSGVIDVNADVKYRYIASRFVHRRTPGEKP